MPGAQLGLGRWVNLLATLWMICAAFIPWQGEISVMLVVKTLLCTVCLVTVLGQDALARGTLVKELPIPPLPPVDHPSSLPAPVPDDSVQGPMAEITTGPSVALRFYRAPIYAPGSGF